MTVVHTEPDCEGWCERMTTDACPAQPEIDGRRGRVRMTRWTGGWDAHDVLMWRLALEGRYHLGARTRAGLYLAGSAGAVFMVETRTLGPREASVTQSGALLGAAVGYVFGLPLGFGVALSLRGYYTFMSDDAPDLGSADYEAHAWGALPWIGLAVDVSLGAEL